MEPQPADVGLGPAPGGGRQSPASGPVGQRRAEEGLPVHDAQGFSADRRKEVILGGASGDTDRED